MGCQLWEVVGGTKGGILVRTGKDVKSDECPERLSTGALIEELEREGERVCYRRLSGTGPSEGWVSLRVKDKDLLTKASGIWEVVGGGSKGGVLVRSGFETESSALADRLSTGSLVREVELRDVRLHFRRLTGTGPEIGWVSTNLNDGKVLMSKVDPSAYKSGTPATLKKSPYDGVELKVEMYNDEKQLSYESFPAWVPAAAARAKLLRENKPYLPNELERPERIDKAKPLAPFQRLNPKQLEEMSKKNMPGCFFGLCFPKTAEEMKSSEFGAEWLTKAFHAAGTLPADNRVVNLVRAEPLPTSGFDAAGGAAMKMFLTVEYEKPDPELHTELFCKYPYSMEEFPVARRELSGYGDADGPEIAVQMSLTHLFPFRTAKFYFGEVCRETTNFILISETIPFSKRGRVENGKVVEHIDYEPYRILPVPGKYQDFLLSDPAEYYCSLFRTMGQMAAWDKQGRYDDYFGPAHVYTEAEYVKATADQRKTLTGQQMEGQRQAMGKVVDTAIDYMRNVIPNMVSQEMLAGNHMERVKNELLDIFPHFTAMSGRYQLNNPDYMAAMHVNLQADNAFFWRDEYGKLDCGVIDWGGFARAPFCMLFLGCLSGADPEIMIGHEESIIRCFRDEYHRCGGPKLPLEDLLLRYHLGFITYAYEACTWIERDVYKQGIPKEEMRTWTGILDERFQSAFRVRCRSSTVINAFTVYHLRGDYFKKTFEAWAKGKGAAYISEFK